MRSPSALRPGVSLKASLTAAAKLVGAQPQLQSRDLCDLGLARSGTVADIGAADAKDAALLTDYVATRLYRAPEILLGSTRYTKGVDMWSVGCILAEMLLGSPLFPGQSTLHQLELVLELTGRPNQLDIKSVKSKHTAAMLEAITLKAQRTWASVLPQAGADAIDLLSRLLVFNPDRRLSVEAALRHPYLSQFHNSADEPVLHSPIRLSIDDNQRYKIAEYRKYLYRKIVERKKQLRAKRAEQSARTYAAGGPSGAGNAGAAQQQQQHQQYSQQASYQHPLQQQSRPAGSPSQGIRPAASSSAHQSLHQAAYASLPSAPHPGGAGYNMPAQAADAFYKQQAAAAAAHSTQQYKHATQTQHQQPQYSQQRSQQPYQQPPARVGSGGAAGPAYQSSSSGAYGSQSSSQPPQPQYNVGGDVGARNQLHAMAAGQRRAMR